MMYSIVDLSVEVEYRRWERKDLGEGILRLMSVNSFRSLVKVRLLSRGTYVLYRSPHLTRGVLVSKIHPGSLGR
jgi:hypothetical protein